MPWQRGLCYSISTLAMSSHVDDEKNMYAGDKNAEPEVVVVASEAADTPYEPTTVRGLKPRHVQVMAISGAIGTGLFVSRVTESPVDS